MNHDGCDLTNQSNCGVIVMTKNEMYRVRTGRVIEYHFHGPQFPNHTVFFFVSDENHLVTQKSKIGKEYIKQGSVCPVVIPKDQILKLESGDVAGLERILETDPPFRITIMGSETYKKIIKDRREQIESST